MSGKITARPSVTSARYRPFTRSAGKPDEHADDERTIARRQQRRDERHVPERDAEPRVLVIHQQRGRVRADAEECAVPDRHLAVVAGEEVEAHRRDADVERLRDQPRVGRAVLVGKIQPKNTISTATTATDTARPSARCCDASSHALHACRAEQAGGPEQQHEQDEAERHDQVDAVQRVDVLRW